MKSGETSFLERYANAFAEIEGMFQLDAALLFLAYNELIRERGIAGNVLEIGVHHGLSTITVAAMRGDGAQLYAVDLFEDLQEENISNSGSGNYAKFRRNLGAFFDDLDFLAPFKGNSAALQPDDLGDAYSFCHVDGGHSDEETYHDLVLCAALLRPGGLLALDDYFNPAFPGVSEGAVRFNLTHPGALTPLAIGFNKVLFQKPLASFSLNSLFANRFNYIPREGAVMWGCPVNLFWSGWRYLFDLERSTPHRLKRGALPALTALLEPETDELEVSAGADRQLIVNCVNTSQRPFLSGEGAFGLSYHLLSGDGVMLQMDHPRTYFQEPLPTGAAAALTLTITAPVAPGRYVLELDIVWEGVCWFRDRGSQTALVTLTVT